MASTVAADCCCWGLSARIVGRAAAATDAAQAGAGGRTGWAVPSGSGRGTAAGGAAAGWPAGIAAATGMPGPDVGRTPSPRRPRRRHRGRGGDGIGSAAAVGSAAAIALRGFSAAGGAGA
jgi:hypothetical protein